MEKIEPSRKLSSFLLVVLLLFCFIVCLAGCTNEEAATAVTRFAFEEIQRVDTPGDDSTFYVMTDSETGRQYLFVLRYGGLAITELLPPIKAGEESDKTVLNEGEIRLEGGTT